MKREKETEKYRSLIKTIESQLSDTLEHIQEKPLYDYLKPFTSKGVKSWFPLIGRGNVLREKTISHSEIDAWITKNL